MRAEDISSVVADDRATQIYVKIKHNWSVANHKRRIKVDPHSLVLAVSVINQGDRIGHQQGFCINQRRLLDSDFGSAIASRRKSHHSNGLHLCRGAGQFQPIGIDCNRRSGPSVRWNQVNRTGNRYFERENLVCRRIPYAQLSNGRTLGRLRRR